MKIGLLVDDMQVARWQKQALATLGPGTDFVVYSCTNTKTRRRLFSHAFYYLLNFAALRSRMTRRGPLPPLRIARRVDFAADDDGAWQKLPPHILADIAGEKPQVMIKFGMGLLRVPPESELACPILSYHHGDPRKFRGRPAGFYELLQRQPTVGQMVQLLSDRLDGGAVVAFAETKASAHSYRATMREAYRCSPLLLRPAIDNALAGRSLPIEPDGKVYRLPSNWTVARFVAGRVGQALRHLLYGMFYEKAWQVAEAPIDSGRFIGDPQLPCADGWAVLPIPAGYRFVADPFFHPDASGILVEALSKSTGLGEILAFEDGRWKRLSDGEGHYSYPAPFAVNGDTFLVPEIAEWSSARLYRLAADRMEETGSLLVTGRPRLVDPTIYSEDGRLYLFANLLEEGNVLRLWHRGPLDNEFVEHSESPVRISPAGARMGGLLIDADGLRYRIGQDARGAYGDGLCIFRIEEMSPTRYRESLLTELRLQTVRGPHTMNFAPGRVLFDFYRDRLSLLAGLRRLRARLRRTGRYGRESSRQHVSRSSAIRTGLPGNKG